MKKDVSDNNKFLLVLLLGAIFISVFVLAANFNITAMPTSVNESTNNTYNFTISNTDATANITQVNITIPSGFLFINGTNGTSIISNFSNTTTLLMWNSTSLIANGTTEYFWFNETSGTPGTYNFTISTLDSSSVLNSTNVSITVNDTTAPYFVGFISPTSNNNTNLSQDYLPINISANDSYSDISAIMIYLYNSTGLFNNTNISVNSGLNATAFFNFTNLTDGVYYINATVNDSAGNTNSTLTRTITLDTTNPFVKIYSPTNTTYSTTSIDLNYTSSDTNLNTTWYNYNGTNTTLTGNTTFTALEGISTLTLFANDSAGNINSTNVTFTVDTTAPSITLISPANGVSSTTTAYNFTFNVVDTNNVSNCSLIFNGHIIMGTITNVNNNGTNGIYYSSLGTGTTRTWSVNCTDFVGNVGNSTTRTLTTNAVSSSSSSSSSGFGYPTYWASQNELNNGYNRSLYKNWEISFKFGNESYQFKLADITNLSAQINVGSGNGVSLSVGQEKMLNLNGDNYYDISVILNSIDTTSKIYPKASFTIKTIHQEISSKKEASNSNNSNENTQKAPQNKVEKQEQETSLTWIWVLIAVVLIFILSGFGYKKFKR